LKSLVALLAIVTLSFGCASVTDASLMDETTPETPEMTQTDDSAVFSTDGNDQDPIVEKDPF
ncbi:MAG: hypothetical protein FH748_04440, partial [Balneolaceae bacterium]|nr:hypothetical protein [Balneolaceae bacterium]